MCCCLVINNQKHYMAEQYTNVEVQDLGDSEYEISAEIPLEKVNEYRSTVLEDLRQTADIPGFRKGNAPDSVLVNQYGEERVLRDAAERAIADVYPHLLKDQEIDAVGRPSVSLTKLAEGNPIGFTIKTAVMPDVTLPEYKSIAGEVMQEYDPDSVEASQEEVDNVVNEVRRMRQRQESQESSQEGSEEDTGAEQSGDTEQEQEGQPEQEQEQSQEQSSQQEEESLPELDDEFVQTLGDFQNVADFREKITANVREEKQKRERDKYRMQALEKIGEQTQATVPNVMIESELDRMMSQLYAELERAGVSAEQYFQQLGKSEEDMRNEWRDEAEKRARLQLVLNAIAEREQIQPTEEEIEKEIEHIMQHYPDADKDAARTYATSVLANEKVFQLLENQKNA